MSSWIRAESLRGQRFGRGMMFRSSLHALPVPGGLRPAITVPEGDRKLDRFFPMARTARPWWLHHLTGERRDASARQPDCVDALSESLQAASS